VQNVRKIVALPRPEVRLSGKYLRFLETAVTQIPQVQASLEGVHEGRSLQGLYRLEIKAASLVPVEEEKVEKA
jgi:hypothetical protein